MNAMKKLFITAVLFTTTVTLDAQIAPPGQSSPGATDAPQPTLQTIYGTAPINNDSAAPGSDAVSYTGILIYQPEPVNANIYPNPTSDFINIEFGIDVSGYYIIEVFNALGELLNSQQFNATSTEMRTQVSYRDYPDGVYLMTVRKLDGSESITFRVLKNAQY